MKYSALVPVKSLGVAKSRLASHLSQHQRETLVLDMLQHVIHTLCDSEIFEQVYVVSADTRVLELALHWGAEGLREARPGHNPALQAAALTIMERAAWREGLYSTWFTLSQQIDLQQIPDESILHTLRNEALLTISADLPLLTTEDVLHLTRLAERYEVVLAGSSEGTGTNALLVRPPLVLPYLFGVNSLPTYMHAASTRKLSYTLYHNAHLAFDVDTPNDVHQLEQTDHAWLAMAGFAR
ncbi:MAG TPA: NTP transferase domain-containing protein [Ktedonobacteraceae bacterium]|jgi:2-phospho-L-lactate guanylyltransferase